MHVSDTIGAKVRSGLIWSAVRHWGVRLSGLLLFMVMARLLTPAELGLFAAASVVLTFLNLLSDQGLTEAVVQRERISQEQLNAVFWMNLGVALLVVAALWGLAPAIASWMNLPPLEPVLRVSALSVPLTAATFGQMAMRRRQFSYQWIATSALTSTVVAGGVALAMAFAGYGVWSLVVQSLLAAGIASLMMWVRPVWRLTRPTDFAGVRPLVGYGANRLFTYLLDFANTRYIEIFLASSLGPAALGLYAVGVRVYQALMQALSSAILDVAHSGFSRLANDREALVRGYYNSMTATAATAVPIFCLVAAVAPSMTVVLFGQRWADSAEVMRWMCLLGAVQVLQFYNGTVFNAIGRPSLVLLLQVCKVLLTFGALVLVRDQGLRMLVYTYVASQLATTPLNFFLLRRILDVSMRRLWQKLWPFVGACVVMVAVAWACGMAAHAFRTPPILGLLASSVLGMASYFFFLRVVAYDALREAIAILRPRAATT